jgi:hypothetical protein
MILAPAPYHTRLGAAHFMYLPYPKGFANLRPLMQFMKEINNHLEGLGELGKELKEATQVSLRVLIVRLIHEGKVTMGTVKSELDDIKRVTEEQAKFASKPKSDDSEK